MRFQAGQAADLRNCELEQKIGFMRHKDDALLIVRKEGVPKSLSDNIARVAHWLGSAQLPLCTIRLLSPANAGALLHRVQRKLAAELLGEEFVQAASSGQIMLSLERLALEAPIGFLDGQPSSFWSEEQWDYFLTERSST